MNKAIPTIEIPAEAVQAAADRRQLIGAIHNAETDFYGAKAKRKLIADDLKDEIKLLDEYKEVENLKEQLKAAKLHLETAIKRDPDINRVKSELESQSNKVADCREILSHQLVTYFGNTQKTVVKALEGENRSIIITAKLGDPTIDQEELPLT